MINTSGNAHNDMVPLWYVFLCDSFVKSFLQHSHQLTLKWFLFGMGSYVVLEGIKALLAMLTLLSIGRGVLVCVWGGGWGCVYVCAIFALRCEEEDIIKLIPHMRRRMYFTQQGFVSNEKRQIIDFHC